MPIQARLVTDDALSRFIRHETSAVFAVLPGAAPGARIGQSLLDA